MRFVSLTGARCCVQCGVAGRGGEPVPAFYVTRMRGSRVRQGNEPQHRMASVLAKDVNVKVVKIFQGQWYFSRLR